MTALSSSYSMTTLAAALVLTAGDMPKGWKPNPTREVTVLCVRYRRHLPPPSADPGVPS